MTFHPRKFVLLLLVVMKFPLSELGGFPLLQTEFALSDGA